MRLVDPAELSALIDGELSPERAAEVRRALEEDQALRRQYESLLMLDAELKDQAQSAVFTLRVRWPEPTVTWWPSVVVAALALLVLRVVLKLMPSVLEVSLEVIALTFFAGCVLRRLLAGAEQEGQRLARQETEG